MKLLILVATIKAVLAEGDGSVLRMPDRIGRVLALNKEMKSRSKIIPRDPLARSLQASCSVYDVQRSALLFSALPDTASVYTNSDDESPTDIQCEETAEDCVFYSYQVEDIDTLEDLDGYFATESTSACIRCELIYATSEVATCNDLDCERFNCVASPDGGIAKQQDGTRSLQTTESNLRFDGVYVLPFPVSSLYLLFSDNGGVEGAWSSLSPDIVVMDFQNQDSYASGTYVLSGTVISFSLTGDMGVMNFDGTVGQDMLTLDSENESTGESTQGKVYSFIPMEIGEPALGTGTCDSTLYGIDISGDMYRVDTMTGNLTFIAYTGIDNVYAASADSKGHVWAMTRDDPTSLYEINATTGLSTRQEVTGIPLDSGGVLSMAIDSQDNLFVVVGQSEAAVRDIYKVDLVQGNTTKLSRIVGKLEGCAFDTSADDLLCMDDVTLITVDPYTGGKSFVADIPYSYGTGDNKGYNQAVEFDPCTRTIWLAYSGLASYDLNTKTVKEVAEFDNKWLYGLSVTTTGTLPLASSSTSPGSLPSPTPGGSTPTVLSPSPGGSTPTVLSPTPGGSIPTPSPRPTNRPTLLAPQPTNRPTLPPTLDEVTLCFVSRIYYTMEVTYVGDEDGDSYCHVWPDRLEFTTEYTKGVSNVQDLTVIYDRETDPLNPDENILLCEVLVDGVECNTCEFCDDTANNLDGYEVDCTNISDGATTSCDAILETIGSELLILQG